MSPGRLQGLTIGITADRRADEQARMFEQRGARVLHGPVLRTAPVDDQQGARMAMAALLRDPPDVLVANTALGIRTWLSLADGWGVTDDLVTVLSQGYVTARGPKAAGALLTIGVAVDWQAPSAVLDELVDHLLERGVSGRRIALQVDGGQTPAAVARLRAAGAEVVEIATYRWTLPKDRGPALRLVDAACNGGVDALTFTAAPAVHNLFALADEAGAGDELRAALDGPVLTMCVGPVCRRAALDRGVASAREPTMARLGGMVKSLADELDARRRSVHVDGLAAMVQGALVSVGDAEVTLAARERALFEVLSRRPGAVVARRTLLAEVWGTPNADAHALEVTIGRLRRRLSPTGLGVEAVSRRGYRLRAVGGE
ncbi:MAG TPA: uroporphyrinogen-III synthase [Acidimicrobiales bacterium]|nr:uroporphyrinogen-III synthase [Acidimicrobiales bacterium]